MYTHSHPTLLSRTEDMNMRDLDERLRLAGYQDGERHPRFDQHWVNYARSQRLPAHLRLRHR